MRSPFAIFRKNAQVMTVVLTGLAMFAFVVLGSIEQMPTLFPPVMGFLMGAVLFWALSGKKGIEGGAIAVVGGIVGILLMVFVAPKFFGPKPEYTLNGKNVSTGEINLLVKQRESANQFIESAYRAVAAKLNDQEKAKLSSPSFFGFGRSRQSIREDVMVGYVLNLKADEMGVTISDDVVTRFINKEVTTNRLSQKQLGQILSKLRISEKQLYDSLRNELRARTVFLALRPHSFEVDRTFAKIGRVSQMPNPVLPEELWDSFRKVEVTQAMNVIPFSVESFVDETLQPPKEELEKFFETYKSRNPHFTEKGEFAPGEPGFLQPRRIQIGYLEADNKQAEEAVRKRLEEEVIPAKEITELKANTQTSLTLFKTIVTGKLDRKEINQFEADEQISEKQASADLLIKALSSPKPVKWLDYLVLEYYEQNKEFQYKNEVFPEQKPEKKEEPKNPTSKTEQPNPKKNETDKKEEKKKASPAPKEEKKQKTSLRQAEQRLKFVSFLEDEKKKETGKKIDEKKSEKQTAGDKKKKETTAPAVVPPVVAKKSDKKNEDKEVKPLPKYRPLDGELKSSIEDIIVAQHARKDVEDRIGEAAKHMNEIREQHFADVNRSRLKSLDKDDSEEKEKVKEEESKPKLTDKKRLEIMQEYASKHQLKYVELELLSANELNDLAKENQSISNDEIAKGKLDSNQYLIGLATELTSNPRPVIDVLFIQKTLLLYTVYKANDNKNGKQFAYWAIDDAAQHTPQFKDAGIEEKVLKAWRIVQATPLANKRAEEVSKQIQEGKLFTPLVDLAVAELKEELVSRGMKKEIGGQDMLEWLENKIAAHQEAISDTGKDDKKEKPEKKEPAKKTEEKKTDTKKSAPDKKDGKAGETKKEKTSDISHQPRLKYVTYQEKKPAKEKDKKEPGKDIKPKPKTPKTDGSSTKKTPPVKKKVEADKELLKLESLSKTLVYTTGLNPHFELSAPVEAIDILDWLSSRIETPKGDPTKKEQLEKVRTGLTLLGKKGTPLLSFKFAGSFSWLQRTNAFNPQPVRFSVPTSIEKADGKFMKYVFEELKDGETGVIANADRSITYVVTVRDRTPTSETNRLANNQKFMTDAGGFQSPLSTFPKMLLPQQQNLNNAWFVNLLKEYGLDFSQQQTQQK